MTMEAHDQVVSELEAHRTGDCTGENHTDGPSAPLTSTADDPRHEGGGSRKGWLANQDTQGSRMSEGGGSRRGWLANQDTQGSRRRRMSEGGGSRMSGGGGRQRWGDRFTHTHMDSIGIGTMEATVIPIELGVDFPAIR